jgi:hypothetical protein
MTSDSHAVSMTSLVVVWRLLISMTRVICAKKEPLEEPEVAAGDSGGGGEGFGVCVVAGIEGQPEGGPVVMEDEAQLVDTEWPEVLDEADAAVELRVSGESFLDPGHADQDHAEMGAVVVIA